MQVSSGRAAKGACADKESWQLAAEVGEAQNSNCFPGAKKRQKTQWPAVKKLGRWKGDGQLVAEWAWWRVKKTSAGVTEWKAARMLSRAWACAGGRERAGRRLRWKLPH